MKIKIYYTDTVPAPGVEKRDGKMVGKDVDEDDLTHRLVWAGNCRDLDFDYAGDERTLEAAFDYFNRKEPDNFDGDFRSLSIGDVVCLENKCYLCQTVGWREIKDFQPNAEQTN